MQCPPTRPGVNGRKFHFVPAASNTDWVSIVNLSKIIASSLMRAIFTSLCVFSIIFAASAILILAALCVPATIICWYKLSISIATSGVDPEVIFLIFLNLCFLSPGLILSGEYPQ